MTESHVPDRIGDQLPEFAKPPIVEVALSVQFQPLPELRSIRLGRLQEAWRNSYPRYEEHPAITTPLEGSAPGVLSLQVITSPIVPSRHWFLSEDGTRLIQIQNDRLVVNWRQLDTEAPYPRFTRLRESLVEAFGDLSRFVDNEGIGKIVPAQVEVTYINAIVPTSGELWRLDEVISGVDQPKPGALGQPLQARFGVIYDLLGVGRPPTRMYMSVDSGMKTDATPALFLSLTARGAPAWPTFDSALDFADDARRHIVTGFAELTTPQMHTIWERIS